MQTMKWNVAVLMLTLLLGLVAMVVTERLADVTLKALTTQDEYQDVYDNGTGGEDY